MTHHGNDRWSGSFVPEQLGHHVYAIEAWTDEFATWRRGSAITISPPAPRVTIPGSAAISAAGAPRSSALARSTIAASSS